mmetsp:Transcript_78166/g.217064  ORF Transcript_78166/g.217064 Transcript_78166/m.217064 type:complete len:298 (-) Transcript_78166:343-1236(-)
MKVAYRRGGEPAQRLLAAPKADDEANADVAPCAAHAPAAAGAAPKPLAASGAGRPLQEFRVTVTKHSEELGLDIRCLGCVGQVAQALLVGRVKPGPVMQWNAGHPHSDVRRGDCIVEVNGFRGRPAQLLRRLRAKRVLDLVFQRPMTADVVRSHETDPRSGPRLGLRVSMGNDCLVVCAVDEGPVLYWNRAAPKGVAVQRGDLLVEVNGRCGNCDVLLRPIQSERDLRLTFVRPLQDPAIAITTYLSGQAAEAQDELCSGSKAPRFHVDRGVDREAGKLTCEGSVRELRWMTPSRFM